MSNTGFHRAGCCCGGGGSGGTCLTCCDCPAEDFWLDLTFNGDMAELDGRYYATAKEDILVGETAVGCKYTMEAGSPISTVSYWTGDIFGTPEVDGEYCWGKIEAREIVTEAHTYSVFIDYDSGVVGDCNLPDTNALSWRDEVPNGYATTKVDAGCDA